MKIRFQFGRKKIEKCQLVIVGAYLSPSKPSKADVKKGMTKPLIPVQWSANFLKTSAATIFSGKVGQKYYFNLPDGTNILLWGLGEESKISKEIVRKEGAKIIKEIKALYQEVYFDLDSFCPHIDESFGCFLEGMLLAHHSFDRHKSHSTNTTIQSITLGSAQNSKGKKRAENILRETQLICRQICFARDLVNEAPNHLNSISMAKLIAQNAKKISGVKVKILGKTQIEKEKMGLFLAVNAASAHPPRLVHLSYKPKKAGKKISHLALVGKGLTFDTGGYSLKPAASMENMKTDMAGAATVYAAFACAAILQLPIQLSCFLGITDNAVSATGTMPDSIVRARNGKTVEILNTDAEGRLVLADVIDYACDWRPNWIIDAATLTGAVVVALGTEFAGVMGNNGPLIEQLIIAAKEVPENLWQLPIIPEYSEDLKSPVADLKNVGSSRNAGASKGAAFLQEFVRENIPWAHLDIAGIADAQGHLPYCPKKGSSGLMIRTLLAFIRNLSDGKF